jgi:hypothetical protein
MSNFCYSCAAPLNNAEFQGLSDIYCQYCTDDKGRLKSRKEVQKGIAEWLQSWQPHLDEQQALTRASDYMKAMPAWAR